MTAPAFTERDVEKAVAGAIKGGFKIGRVEVDRRTGRIILLPEGAPDMQNKTVDPKTEIERWLEENGAGES